MESSAIEPLYLRRKVERMNLFNFLKRHCLSAVDTTNTYVYMYIQKYIHKNMYNSHLSPNYYINIIRTGFLKFCNFSIYFGKSNIKLVQQ